MRQVEISGGGLLSRQGLGGLRDAKIREYASLFQRQLCDAGNRECNDAATSRGKLASSRSWKRPRLNSALETPERATALTA